MATCADINPALAADFAAKDTNRIQGSIGKVLMRRSPWLNVLSGGNISNDSDTVRSVIQERAVSNISLAEPEFVDDTTQCGQCGDSLEVGETEYSYGLQTLRGEGPLVCVKTARTAFKDSYLRAQESLEMKIVEIMNADVRATLLRRSGVKYNVRSTLGFSTNLTGDAQQIDTLFAANPSLSNPSSFRAWLWGRSRDGACLLVIEPPPTNPSPGRALVRHRIAGRHAAGLPRRRRRW
jgi:hypothetical protein